MRKERITITIDPDLLQLAEQAIADGRARSVSAYVNDALRDKQRRQQRARELLTAMVHEHELADPTAYAASRAKAEALVAHRTGQERHKQAEGPGAAA